MPLTKHDAEELIRENGGKFVRSGRSHDIWESAEGEAILIPRHSGDLSTGVENKIKKTLGLK